MSEAEVWGIHAYSAPPLIPSYRAHPAQLEPLALEKQYEEQQNSEGRVNTFHVLQLQPRVQAE